MKESKEGITVKKEENMPEWYEQAVQKAELADFAPISGFMVIKPRGYAIWENIQNYFNKRIKFYGVKNTYFPLLIPESYFKREAEHAKGFEPELAWVQKDEGERLAIRPTSETIIHDFFSKWIRSYRDLPLRINQWCNILRWEVKQTKLFLRSREFLWQEGHCAYETEEECEKEVLLILEEYRKLAEEILAIPVLVGEKTEKERFAGAKRTYTIEALMPDGKALQLGTSHNLGQGFSKVFNVKFLGKDEKEHLVWLSSWGFSTRLIGAIVMAHGDNKGLVLPPAVSPLQITIIPILTKKDKEKVLKKCQEIKEALEKNFTVEIDSREDYSPGWKFNEQELYGTPLRIELGPKDLEKDQVVLVRRDLNTKKIIKTYQLKKEVEALLDTIQKSLYVNAKRFLDSSIVEVKAWEEFLKTVKDKKITLASFCGEVECEDYIKSETDGATSRCIKEVTSGKCIKCNNKAKYKVYFSKSY
ncbi:MAG: proline--tRNA ligase [Candidatus Woesearchaeota archaeon]|nr:MAG: proline--tRNA ligase [Candidatus Woesearchaeota archaeon]